MKLKHVLILAVLAAAVFSAQPCLAEENVFTLELRLVDHTIGRTGPVRVQVVGKNMGDNALPTIVMEGQTMRAAVTGTMYLHMIDGNSNYYGETALWPECGNVPPHSDVLIDMVDLRSFGNMIPKKLRPGVYVLTFSGKWEGVESPYFMSSVCFVVA